ncbi:MAG: DUF3784 domain-containing protein [Defluviitaleaceae bacterium]|nr:DUF3784 domain-containing protein [Defluviitaleaceae bacterium]
MIISFAINIPIIIMLVAMGITLLCGKGGSLLAGWNTMSEAEQAKYDKKVLFRFLGLMLILLAGVTALIPIGIYFDNLAIVFIAAAFMLVIPIAAVVYANSSKRFRSKN